MGQILSQPRTEKSSEEGGDDFVAYGLSCMQGWRVSMEDSHSTVLNLLQSKDSTETKDSKSKQIAFFGVYDGHGGEKVALFTGENLPRILLNTGSFKKGNFEQALKDCFLSADIEILNDDELSKDPSGCAATSVIITDDKIVCGNAGDSRTIMSINGNCKPLSFDHKPTNEGEKARIVAAGGYVDLGRVNGNLALSRGIGDFEFKNAKHLPAEEQAVTALPDILEHNSTVDDEFIVLACDGIWDCLTSQQVIDFVRRGIKENKSLTEICELMMDTCLAPTSGGSGIGCDNMSVCIVALLKNNETLEQWYEKISKKITEEDLKQLPTADQLSIDLYKIDVETKMSDNKDNEESNANNNKNNGNNSNKKSLASFDENSDESSILKGGAPAFIQQLLAASSISQDNNVIYLDPSATSILQSLGVMEEDADNEHEHEHSHSHGHDHDHDHHVHEIPHEVDETEDKIEEIKDKEGK